MSPLAPAPVRDGKANTAWYETDPTGCLAASPVAAAFTEDSLVKPLTTDSAVQAVLRESADGSRMVLGLHNPSSAEAGIALAAVLPEHAGAQWHFVRGAVRSSDEADGLYAHVSPAGCVWLTVTP